MNYPKVSVIIPLFNYRDYVCDTIESIMQQTYKGEIETIVVDDCSTDRSVEKIKIVFKRETPKIIRHPINKGYSVAKNTGIRASTGEFIVLIDADDMLTPESIAVRAERLRRYPATGMVHGKVFTIYGEGGLEYWMKRRYKIGVSKSKKIHAQSTMIRRSVHLEFGLYDERLKSRSDNEMWNRLKLYECDPRIICEFIEDPPVAFYRKHDKSMIAYRKKHPAYNYEVSRLLEEAKSIRARDGINPKNTPWLDK